MDRKSVTFILSAILLAMGCRPIAVARPAEQREVLVYLDKSPCLSGKPCYAKAVVRNNSNNTIYFHKVTNHLEEEVIPEGFYQYEVRYKNSGGWIPVSGNISDVALDGKYFEIPPRVAVDVKVYFPEKSSLPYATSCTRLILTDREGIKYFSGLVDC